MLGLSAGAGTAARVEGQGKAAAHRQQPSNGAPTVLHEDPKLFVVRQGVMSNTPLALIGFRTVRHALPLVHCRYKRHPAAATTARRGRKL